MLVRKLTIAMVAPRVTPDHLLTARFRSLEWLVLVTILGVLCLYPTDTSAEELVTFKSASYRLGQLQRRLAREHGEMPQETSEMIEGYLSTPEGNGPFAAIVYLHGCGGLSETTRKRIAGLMTKWGYVSLVADSFATRGIKQACDKPMPARQGDALGALSYLSSLPFVDPHRVALVGSSQGGIVALELASHHPVEIFDVPEDRKFSAAVAYYPFCNVAAAELSIPTLIMIGELDDWAPAKDCDRWMQTRSGRGASVKLVVYPGAHHDFDNPGLDNGMRLFGHWLKYDADAASKSVQEMQEFLSKQLSREASH